MSADASQNSGLVRRFEQLTATRAEQIAIEDDREQVSFGELGVHARRVARALEERGLCGKRIAMLVTQGACWVETFYGILQACGVVVPLSHLHPESEQKFFVETSGAEALIVSDALKSGVLAYSSGRVVLSIDELRRSGAEGDATPSQSDDVALILYTSGTTGKPKGALITHSNLARLAELVGQAWSWSESDVLLHALPLHHLHGLGISLLVSLSAGSRSRMFERFDADRIWEAMGRSSVLMGVPTMHKKLLDAFDAAPAATQSRWRAHAAQLRLVTSGSAALPASVAERWRSLTGNYPLERFGMTEIGVGASNPVHGERRPGTCGPALPGIELRIVAEDGSEARPGEPGEIWIKGPTVFKGYDKNPEATAEAFVDGWFRSGDTATWDDGYVKILGRTSIDILKSGGYKLSALEIEELVREHAGIADVAVVGLPDETWGEIAVAAVLLREGATLEEQQLRDWAKQRIAPYKVPKRVVIFDDFPRNPVGKVLKPELKRILATKLRGGP